MSPAGVHVRSAATLGGHLYLTLTRKLPSDVVPSLIALAAQLQLTNLHSSQWLSVEDYISKPGGHAAASDVITAVRIPYATANHWMWSKKVALRYVNSHALVNAAIVLKFDQSRSVAAKQTAAAMNSGTAPRSHTFDQSKAVAGKVTDACIVVGHPTDGKGAATATSNGAGSSGLALGAESWCIHRCPAAETALKGNCLDVQVGQCGTLCSRLGYEI